MKSVFPALCLLVMVAAVVKSQRKIRTVVYGCSACTGVFAIFYVLTEGLRLNGAIMAMACVPIMLVISAYTMWTHSRTTMKQLSDKAKHLPETW